MEELIIEDGQIKRIKNTEDVVFREELEARKKDLQAQIDAMDEKKDLYQEEITNLDNILNQVN